MNYSHYNVTQAGWHAGEFIVINFDIKCGDVTNCSLQSYLWGQWE
jgi:hypothetical protein